MKKHFLFSALLFLISCFGFAQNSYIKFSSVIPENIEAGTTLKVNYKYTATADTNIYCGINLQDDWTWVSFIGGEGKKVSAGTDVEGSFDILIPKGTKPSSDLKDKLNYKINIEMKSVPDYTWIAGDYPAIPLNIVISK